MSEAQRYDMVRVSESDFDMEEHANGDWVRVDDYSKLESLLSASQAREAELREKLDGLTGEACELVSKLEAAIEHERQTCEVADNFYKKLEAAEAAAYERNLAVESAELYIERLEARIKASQEQEPVAYVTDWEGSRSLSFNNPKVGAITTPLYAAPVIPPELEELQRENAELRKLLEGNVLEGWQLVPKNETEAMHDAVMAALYKGVTRMNTQSLLDAYLAAAPQQTAAQIERGHVEWMMKQNSYGFVPSFLRFRRDQCGCLYAEYELQLTDCGGEFEGQAPTLAAIPPLPKEIKE